MDPVWRRELTRYGAPAAFLVAVTIAVLLIRSGLDTNSQTTTAALPTTTAPPRTTTPTTTITLTGPSSTTASTTTTISGARYYVIQSGDTLGDIASRYGTSVDQLMTLNPGLDAVALQPGQRIRVG